MAMQQVQQDNNSKTRLAEDEAFNENNSPLQEQLSLNQKPHSKSTARKRKNQPITDKTPKSEDVKSKKLKTDLKLNNSQKYKEQDTTLVEELTTFKKLLCQKQETLRQLRLVKLYRTKNNLSQLQELIDKWRLACHKSLMELQDRMPEPKPDVTELIQLWQLDPELLQYKEDVD